MRCVRKCSIQKLKDFRETLAEIEGIKWQNKQRFPWCKNSFFARGGFFFDKWTSDVDQKSSPFRRPPGPPAKQQKMYQGLIKSPEKTWIFDGKNTTFFPFIPVSPGVRGSAEKPSDFWSTSVLITTVTVELHTGIRHNIETIANSNSLMSNP